MILLIDNYDSFTYNLVQRIGELLIAAGQTPDHSTIRVFRNDKITPDEVDELAPAHIIISPGPCTPREGGVSNAVIERFAGRVPLLGVCLGHECIGDVFGMKITRNPRLMHGKTSEIHHDGKTVFAGLDNPFTATRYHSLAIDPDTFDHDRFELSAWTDEDTGYTEIMGLRARAHAIGPAPLEGVQFHPESFLTTEGPKLLANFLGLDAAPSPEPTAQG